MVFIDDYSSFCRMKNKRTNQFWYYVILLNVYELSRAGKYLLANFDALDGDSGERCDFFIPGFSRDLNGKLLQNNKSLIRGNDPDGTPQIDISMIDFYSPKYMQFCRELENTEGVYWKSSGQCELLLFNTKEDDRPDPCDFYAYNLDDIVENRKSMISFIMRVIDIGRDIKDKQTAKKQIDGIYCQLIMPAAEQLTEPMNVRSWSYMANNGFEKDSYYFLSYSTKNTEIVTAIRDGLENMGVRCWMAPRDIPTGTNYAHIISIAIRNAAKVIIFLSPESISSIWVEKELDFAIGCFQKQSPEKIHPVWIKRQVPYPELEFLLTNVQVDHQIIDADTFAVLLPRDKMELVNSDKDMKQVIDDFSDKMIISKKIENQFTELLDIASRFQTQIPLPWKDQTIELVDQLKAQTEELRTYISDLSKPRDSFPDEYGIAFSRCMRQSWIIRGIMYRIMNGQKKKEN